MSKYRLTDQARRDVQHIWNYIAKNNADAADRVITRFHAAMNQLARAPGMGHRRRDDSAAD